MSSKRAIRKAPLRVRGRILISSAGDMPGFNNKSKSSEIKSVNWSVLPIGTELRAFLIQKLNMRG